MHRSFAILIVLALTVVALPARASVPTCSDTIQRLQDTLRDEGNQIGPQSAHVLGEVLAVCDKAPSEPSQLPAVLMSSTRLARDCRLGDVPATTPATVSATLTVGFNAPINEAEAGIATATYSADTNLTSYHVQGVKWAFNSWNQGNPGYGLPAGPPGYGVISLYGVPLPALWPLGWGGASAWCADDELAVICAAQGQAKIAAANGMVALYVKSEFDHC